MSNADLIRHQKNSEMLAAAFEQHQTLYKVVNVDYPFIYAKSTASWSDPKDQPKRFLVAEIKYMLDYDGVSLDFLVA